ncbi:hypothetical protein L345_13065, partial [Ophiophagus hannah]
MAGRKRRAQMDEKKERRKKEGRREKRKRLREEGREGRKEGEREEERKEKTEKQREGRREREEGKEGGKEGKAQPTPGSQPEKCGPSSILAAFSSEMFSYSLHEGQRHGPLTCGFICSSGLQNLEKSRSNSSLSFANKELSTCPAEITLLCKLNCRWGKAELEAELHSNGAGTLKGPNAYSFCSTAHKVCLLRSRRRPGVGCLKGVKDGGISHRGGESKTGPSLLHKRPGSQGEILMGGQPKS